MSATLSRPAAAFEDASVASAYRLRPPYPEALFEKLAALVVGEPRVALDLGCGTGDVAIPLAARVDRVDAVDRSRAMLAIAREAARGLASPPRWILADAESFASSERYGLAVVAQSLHWMAAPVVMPELAALLRPGAVLALVLGRAIAGLPWARAIEPLVARHATGREHAAGDLVGDLVRRGLFVEQGRFVAEPVAFAQSVDDYVESFHSRSILSRERMAPSAARAFDAALRALVAPHCREGLVRGRVGATLVWGRPRG